VAGTGELLGGALLVAVLAVAIDLVLALIQRRLARRADPQRGDRDGAVDLPEFPLPEMQPGRI
jgi:hypothetical protein